MRTTIVSFIFLLTASYSFSQTNPFEKKFPLIDRYIDSLMKDWNIPGLALGIVYKDQLIYGKGYGYRDVQNKLPVTTTTIFPIASNTKLFTATAATMLANEGKLSLDRPVRTYMPSLSFYNDELNAKVTLRDMLSHRTGLPTYNGIWIASTSTRKEAIEKVVQMRPQLGFREGYIYNNMMFAASGAVMENITGTTWEELTRNRILNPLAMTATGFTNDDMMKSGNFAYSYYEFDSTRNLSIRTYGAASDALGPAGTIKSNVEDMSHWMIAQLNGGKYKGQQAIPEAAIKQTLVPNTIADREGKWPELSNSLYALGRHIQTYKGYKIATHTGSIDGYYSNLTFIPSENFSVFMVHNSDAAGSLRSVMAFPIIDRLLNLSRTEWSERYIKDYLKAKADSKRSRDSINATQVKNTVASHPLKDYTGKYNNPLYGDLNIELQNNQLFLLFRRQRSALNHFHYDQFVTDEEKKGNPDFRLSFLTNSKGEIDRFTVRPFGEPIAEFVRTNK
ncbi:MAG TPA: serine hydrolase [Segetibacter sp.]|jgi:CubicO group peptidase (beta-lactamase class C family)